MPKKIDHQARREQIAHALWHVLAIQGLEAVSLRHVATTTGVSMGLVQHYFRTKDEMLLFALATVSEQVAARTKARLTALQNPAAPSALIRAVLLEMLPLDEQRRLEAHVAVAFHARAAVVPSIATSLRAGAVQLQDFLATLFRAAQQDGHAPAYLDPEREAIALLALVDGLSLHVLAQHYTAETALAVFEAHLARLLHDDER